MEPRASNACIWDSIQAEHGGYDQSLDLSRHVTTQFRAQIRQDITLALFFFSKSKVVATTKL
jgi:hypothetical protein